MKFFTVPALLAAALLSVVAVVPFLPAAKDQAEVFFFEAQVASTAAGHLQIFYTDGADLSEQASTRTAIRASAAPIPYRLKLPPGRYRMLRLDPIDAGGTVTIASLRVMSHAGRVLRELPLREFSPVMDVAAVRPAGATGVEIAVAAGRSDPQLMFTLPQPLEVVTTWRERSAGLGSRAGPLWLALAAGLFLLDRAAGARAFFTRQRAKLATRPARAIALVAAGAVVLSAYPVVFLGKSYVSPNLGTALLYDGLPTLPGDTSREVTDVKLSDIGAVMWQHVPFSMMQHRALAHGELPLWNRYNALGVPLLAQGQSMFGDPVHLLVVLANGAAWAWDAKYLLAKWLFAAGLGLTVFAVVRPRPHALAAALVVALAAPFVGFFLYRINHPAFFSLCYAPWPLYCWVRVTQADTRRGVALWAAGLIVANLALMNSGTVKEAYMLLACTNFSGACVLVAAAAPWRERLAKFAALAWAGVIFVLLTAPIWMTFLQTLQNAYTGYNAASAFQIQPTLLLGAFDEIFYRPLMTKDQVFSPSLNFLLLLGVLYFLATLRTHLASRAAIAIAASSLLPLSLAFGFISPEWIVRLPFLANIAHVDNTFSCVLVVLWSVVAGVGFAAAWARLGTPDGRGDLVVAGLLLFALVFGWVAFRQAAHRPIFGPIFTVHQPGQVLAIHPLIWDYLIVLLLATALVAWVARRALVRGEFSAASLLLLTLGLGALLWRHGLHASTLGFETFTARPTPRADFHAQSPAMEFARAAHAKEPGRGFGIRENFFAGWTGVYGLETVHGPDALVNPWVRELVTASGILRMWDWRLAVNETNLAAAQPFFDALNVRYYFSRNDDPAVLAQHVRPRKRADLDVYESPSAWPRAFFTDRVGVYDQASEVIAQFKEAHGRALALAHRDDLAAAPELALLPRDLATRAVVPAASYQFTENTTSFVVRAPGPGVIVLSEALWKDDFRAEVNGRRAPVRRINHAFKGVVVEAAGEYRVTFRYWPHRFFRSLTLCGVGAGLLALSLVLVFWRKRPASPEAGHDAAAAEVGSATAQ